MRSTSIAIVSSERINPSPLQVGQVLFMISRTPSETFWRVISTSPSGEISTTWVRVRSWSSALRSDVEHLVAVARVGHVDEVDDDDPADVAQPQLRTTSSAACRFVLTIVSSRLPRPRPV